MTEKVSKKYPILIFIRYNEEITKYYEILSNIIKFKITSYEEWLCANKGTNYGNNNNNSNDNDNDKNNDNNNNNNNNNNDNNNNNNNNNNNIYINNSNKWNVDKDTVQTSI